eukprot:gnl/TRDRNA2_/TRDRNA2_137122_c1_seq1.p1 gnl/TRDRNA2_/TRDRNA2_137122_c1~~gnl/TRDRNA2_/TRDRNA2_137122_c1_seq1.p1  ORF type:complete len:246 (+),score=42.19 gnl/TRDRNA2_/TRDRNA2_137122_c1_seq1:1-738(+)
MELEHPNIVKLRDVLHAERNLTLVFEFIDQDLKMLIERKGGRGLEHRQTMSLLQQLLRGIAYCHQHLVLHRDLKPQNLLISKDGVLKLCDFGLARTSASPVRSYTNAVITLWYRPPDVLMGSRHYAQTVDIWSIGCIFGEMANGRPVFCGSTDADQLEKIFRKIGGSVSAGWPAAVQLPGWNSRFDRIELQQQPLERLVPSMERTGIALLKQMLVYNPERRISAMAALEHEYFDEGKSPRETVSL